MLKLVLLKLHTEKQLKILLNKKAKKIPNMEQLSTERVLAKIAEHFDVPLSLVSLRIDVLARQDRSESTASVQRS